MVGERHPSSAIEDAGKRRFEDTSASSSFRRLIIIFFLGAFRAIVAHGVGQDVLENRLVLDFDLKTAPVIGVTIFFSFHP